MKAGLRGIGVGAFEAKNGKVGGGHLLPVVRWIFADRRKMGWSQRGLEEGGFGGGGEWSFPLVAPTKPPNHNKGLTSVATSIG